MLKGVNGFLLKKKLILFLSNKTKNKPYNDISAL